MTVEAFSSSALPGHGPEGSFESIAARSHRAGEWLARQDYRGWDPYDGLSGPIARLPGLRRSHLLRFGLQQVVKRSPVNPRRILRIPPGRNPVTIALAAQAHAYLARCCPAPSDEHATRAHDLVAELGRLRSTGWSGSCWGYDFDWNARRLTLPAGTPTAVATGMAINALFEIDRLLPNSLARSMIADSASFVTNDLHQTYDRDGSFCWSYSPFDRQVVLNASMKAARLCTQAGQISGDRRLLELARSASNFVERRQRPDGSWPYAEGDERSWADSFHTGYVLDCLHACALADAGTSASEAVLKRGFAYFSETFIRSDGAALYYPKRQRPIDTTACAQTIITLCTFREIERARRVATWTNEHMSNADGSFAYRMRRVGVDRTPFARWSVAWMFCALARLTLELC